MDTSNVEQRCSATDETNEATNTMYLSFDTETDSTLSSTGFKTLNDTSPMDLWPDVTQDRNKHELFLENTLEKVEVNESHFMLSKQVPPPLGIYSTNILRGTFCSTPTKEQLLRSVEVARGSEVAGGCINLGIAFQGVEDDRPATYFPPAALVTEENKENAHPESGDGSTLSVSSSVEAVTSVIERKMMTLSTAEEEDKEEEDLDKVKEMCLIAKEPPRSCGGADEMDDKAVFNDSESAKPKRCIIPPKNARKSLCEPNLQTNRPSRILANLKKRTSLAATNNINNKQPPTVTDKNPVDGSDIPKVINKLMKISDAKKIPPPPTSIPIIKSVTENKPKSLPMSGNVVKSRTSLLPTAPIGPTAEKRSFKHRMSVLVKTTLNSPARKIPRRSVGIGPPNANQQIRLVGGGATGRRSMLPTGKDVAASHSSRHMTTVNENVNAVKQPPKITIRKSMFSQLKPVTSPEQNSKTLTQTKTNTSGGAISKLEASFVCSVCASKFRIKSLLEAHKRSHEEDLVAAFVKKPSSGGGSSTAIATSGQSKCKYCDKKFALERALHIHLMEKCPKIPPADKRKLEFTEMNHVEKAQLPVFFQGNHVIPHSNAAGTNNHKNQPLAIVRPKMLPKSHSNLSATPMSSNESLDKKEITVIAKELTEMDSADTQMGPPRSTKKIKKKSAHAGVYRTPNKNVPCHICKKSFKSIIELINHSDTMHPQSTRQAPEDNFTTEVPQ